MRHETKHDAAARMARYKALDDYLDQWDRQEEQRRYAATQLGLALLFAAIVGALLLISAANL